MITEQKNSIDACKDQAAQEHVSIKWEYYQKTAAYWQNPIQQNIVIDRALQLYGEQCRKEGAKEAISVISDAIGDLDEMEPRYTKKRVSGVHDFLADSFDKLTAQA